MHGRCQADAVVIRQWIAALANHDGGGELTVEGSGARDPSALVASAVDALSPPPVVRSEVVGGDVRVSVAEHRRELRPCRDGDVAWVLDRGQPREATTAQMEALQDQAGLAACDARRFPWGAPDTISPQLAGRLVDGAGVGLAEHPDLWHASDSLSVAGAVCLGSRALGGVPSIRLLLYRERYAESQARDTMPSNERVLGTPIPSAVEALANELALKLGVEATQRDVVRRLFLELLHNAVAHRSYRLALWAEPIDVSVWTDTVEVSSPGLLAGPVRLVDGWFEGVWSRNPRVHGLLTDLRLAHRQGQGASRCKRLVAHLGWEMGAVERVGRVVVRVHVRSTAPDPDTNSPQKNRAPSRADNTARVHQALVDHGQLSARQVSAMLELGHSTVRAILNRLVDELGVAERTAPGRSSPGQAYRAVAPLEQ